MYNNYVINNRIKRVKKLIVNCIKDNDTNQATEYLDIFTNLILWKFDGPLTLSKQREFNRQILFMQNSYLAMSLSKLNKGANALSKSINESNRSVYTFRLAMDSIDFNPKTGNAFIEQAIGRANRTEIKTLTEWKL